MSVVEAPSMGASLWGLSTLLGGPTLLWADGPCVPPPTHRGA